MSKMETFIKTPITLLTNFGISKLLIGFVMKEMTFFVYDLDLIENFN